VQRVGQRCDVTRGERRHGAAPDTTRDPGGVTDRGVAGHLWGGDPGPIVAALAQVPELLQVAVPFIGAALGPSGIDWRSKEIVIVRTSALAGGHYCVAAHTVVALDAGLDRREGPRCVANCRPRRCSPSSRELALLRWVDTVGAVAGAVDDGARDDVLAHWAVVELTTVVGVILLLNRFATALPLPTSNDTHDRLTREGLL